MHEVGRDVRNPVSRTCGGQVLFGRIGVWERGKGSNNYVVGCIMLQGNYPFTVKLRTKIRTVEGAGAQGGGL